MAELKRATIRVYGLVQGVLFRYHTVAKARELGLVGFVRNERNGSVLVLAEGNQASINRLIQWCKVGPDAAQVEKVDVEWGPATGAFGEFSVE